MMHKRATIFFGILLFFVCHGNAFDADEDVIFKLYKRDNPTNFSVIEVYRVNETSVILNDFFDPKIPTRIHIHGYWSLQKIIDRYRQVYLGIGDFNFIVVDWLEGAQTINYFLAKRRVKEVRKLD